MNMDYRASHTVKPVLSDHIQQDIFWTFQTGGCLLLHESSEDSLCMSFLHYFHTTISNYLSGKLEIHLGLYGRLT